MSIKKPELLAPAGNLKKLKYAFRYGADAAYGSGPAFSMRTKEIEFPYSDIKKGIAHAHKLDKKFYLTLNTYPHQNQLKKLKKHIKKMVKLAPDGLIVADPGVLEMVKKESRQIELHLSTQANALNSKAIKFWAKQGVKRIIIAREASFKEIKEIKKDIPPDIGLEVFVHGAMCISYSGRCLLSSFFTGREANQGQCTQPCRWQYILKETKDPEKELKIEEDKNGTYLLNSKTLCLIDKLDKLKPLNLAALKIEGRNKSPYYLATVVRAYRQVIDVHYLNKSGAPRAYARGTSPRASSGETLRNVSSFAKATEDTLIHPRLHRRGFLRSPTLAEEGKKEKEKIVAKAQADIDKTSNRGFITGFMFQNGQPTQEYLTSRPQSNWQYAATVLSQKNNLVKLKANNQIKAGKVLEFILPDKDIKKIPKHFLDKNQKKKTVINTNDIFYLKLTDKIPKGTIVRQKKAS